MSKILITGGSGFIGSHFHNHMAHEDIINLDIVKPNFLNQSIFIQGDIRIREHVIHAIKDRQIDTIISLAAKHHDFGIGHDEYFDTNEDGTKVLCAIASEYGIKKIVFYSSVAVYGIREEISTEAMDPKPDSPYGASKLAGEKVLEKWVSEDISREVLIIRPTLAFGSNNVANMFNLIRQIDSGFHFHWGKADNIKSIAYVENLVMATLFLISRMKPGVAIYNYADEPQLATREIGEIIAAALKKKIRITIPKSIGPLIGLPFDLFIKLSGKNFPISSSRIKKLSTQTYHSAKKVFEDGFTPEYSTKEGIMKMVAWYKQQSKK
jgi:GlcNAc-P-P-Und epimerase